MVCTNVPFSQTPPPITLFQWLVCVRIEQYLSIDSVLFKTQSLFPLVNIIYYRKNTFFTKNPYCTHILMYIIIYTHNMHIFIVSTVKHGYTARAYTELTLTAMWCISVTLLHVVNLINVTNYAFSKAKSPVPGTSL